MTEAKQGSTWVVVTVECGVPSGVYLCPDADSAEARERELRRHLNEHEDETAVYCARGLGEAEEIVFLENRRESPPPP